MAHRLEVRVPFADYRIVEYAYNLPNKIKLLNNKEKGLLRKSLEKILPKEIIYRKKSPYPKTHNPIYAKLVADEMDKIINDKTSPLLDIVDKKKSPTDIINDILNRKNSKDNNSSLDLIYNSLKK